MTSIEQVRKSGWLVKAPLSLGSKHSSMKGVFSHKKARKRFFVLKDSALEYFEKADGEKAKGSVEISRKSLIRAMENGTSLVVIPYPGSSKELLLHASDAKEASEWLQAIQQVCQSGTEEVEEEKESDTDSGAETEADTSEDEGEEEQDEDLETQSEAKQPETQKTQVKSNSTSNPSTTTTATATGGEPEWKQEWQQHMQRKVRLPVVEYEVVLRGPLEKESSTRLSGWSKKFAVLTDHLHLYDSEESFRTSRDCKTVFLESVIASVSSCDKKQLSVFATGGSYTFRAPSEEAATEWVDKLNNCVRYLRRKDALQWKPVAKDQKVIPSFLQGIKDRVIKSKPLLNHSSPPPLPPTSPSSSSTLEERPGGEETETTETPGVEKLEEHQSEQEDKFAKLRNLRAKLESDKQCDDGLEQLDANDEEVQQEQEAEEEEEGPSAESAAIDEDRFAKLRALRAQRE